MVSDYISREAAKAFFTICADGLVFEEFNEPGDVFHAVPVPPHGRLGDLDALIRDLEITEEDGDNGATLLMAVSLEVLKYAPTIIPAELCEEKGE